MAKDLIVGSTGLLDFEPSIASFLCARRAEARLEAWLERSEATATISCLNGATVMEFLRHAVRLAGYADENAGFADGADGRLHKNFPWWDNSLWLPLDFDNPGGLDDDPTFFIGSCQGLIAELDELKRISPLKLGEAPSAYVEMRSDFLKFVRSEADLGLSAEDCVRWVWLALREGAELAIAEDTPMWAGPD